MAAQKRFKQLSSITKKLLNEGENEYADFKRSVDGISTEDLVSFANTGEGYILLGVTEETGNNGAQVGIVTGCDVSDAAILQILNKAVSCIPPVAVTIYIENLDKQPMLRVHIPVSENKPHCTQKGIYCRRDGNRNRPLHPNELLKIFLDNEGRAFAERFEQSAEKIAGDLSNLEDALKSSIDSMASQLGWTDMQLGDTESTLDAIKAKVQYLVGESQDSSSRLRALFKDKKDDPVREKARNELVTALLDQFQEKPELVDYVQKQESVSLNLSGKAAKELDKEDVQDALSEAIKRFHPKSISKTATQKKSKET